jgi:hemolysin III
MKERLQTLEEEIVNAITHGVGVLLGIAFLPFLLEKVEKNNDSLLYLAVCLFGFGIFAVYISSTLYHAVQEKNLKRKLNICDHICIFFLLGGSYAPFVQYYCEPETAKFFLIVQWSMISIGAVLKLFFTGKYEKASVILYIFLGWMAVFLAKPFYEKMPLEVFKWVLTGGLSYTIGVFFYRWDSQKYAHAIWHLFVLGGTATHFFAIWKMLDFSS